MSKTIRGAVADLSKDISYLELSCENDKLKYGIKQLTEENQRLNDELEAIRKNHIATFPRIHSGFDVYDMSPAQKEGVIRDKLIEMGWIPPETLQTILELPDKWRKYSFDNPEATEYMDSDDCADELEALLPEKDDGS